MKNRFRCYRKCHKEIPNSQSIVIFGLSLYHRRDLNPYIYFNMSEFCILAVTFLFVKLSIC